MESAKPRSELVVYPCVAYVASMVQIRVPLPVSPHIDRYSSVSTHLYDTRSSYSQHAHIVHEAIR